MLAALTLPRIEGESEDAFARRVVEDSLTTRDGAADFGTAFHHGAEQIAKSLEVARICSGMGCARQQAGSSAADLWEVKKPKIKS